MTREDAERLIYMFEDSFRGDFITMNQRKELARDRLISALTSSPVAVDGWISTEGKLPDEEGRYLICYKYRSLQNSRIFIGDWYNTGQWATGLLDIIVTHWMPIPEPPKEVS